MSVIHITGSSGSGKTTIGNELKKNKMFTVYDTDEIVEAAQKELFKRYPNLFVRNEKKFWGKYHEMIQSFFDHIVMEAGKTGKTLVIVGFAVDVQALLSRKKVKLSGFVLDVNKKMSYRRRSERDFEFLLSNKSKIRRIIRKEPVEVIEQKLFMEGVHQSFPPPPFHQVLEPQKPKGYVLIKPQKLLSLLTSLAEL